MRFLLLVYLATPLLAAAFAPVPPPRTRKPGDLRGTWKVIRYEHKGTNRLTGRTLRVRIDPDKLTFLSGDGKAQKVTVAYNLRVDARARPATFDLDKPGTPGVSFRGSFEMKDGKVTLVFVAAEKALRPTFTSSQPDQYLMILATD